MIINREHPLLLMDKQPDGELLGWVLKAVLHGFLW